MFKLIGAISSYVDYKFCKFMQKLGFRKVWYFPSNHGLLMSNFWTWEYRPNIKPGVYDGETCPVRRLEEC